MKLNYSWELGSGHVKDKAAGQRPATGIWSNVRGGFQNVWRNLSLLWNAV